MGNRLSLRAFKSGGDAPDEPRVNNTRCYAHGCPGAGAISDSTKGEGPWFCRDHFGAPADQWPSITTRVRQHGNSVYEGETVTVRAMKQAMRDHGKGLRTRTLDKAQSWKAGLDSV